jgi:hypothetical protein
MLSVTLQVRAHSGGNGDVMATLDTLPAGLGQIKVELHKTLGPQLLVENGTEDVMEVIGTDGVAFLRIGPDGVAANVNAPDWYRFYAVAGIPLPPRLMTLNTLKKSTKLAPDWKMVSRTPAWGWFDTRLDTEELKVPQKVRNSINPTAFKTWRVPVTVAGKRQFLSGAFQFMPRAQGFYQAQLNSPDEIAPGVFLQVLQGPTPGFMLSNTSDHPVIIKDSEGSAFLEVTPSGVRANLRSPNWRQSGLAESSYMPKPLAAGDGPLWQQRSTTPRFTWLDARAAADTKKAGAGSAAQHWEIPFVHNDKVGKIQGTTRWFAYSQSTAAGEESALMMDGEKVTGFRPMN